MADPIRRLRSAPRLVHFCRSISAGNASLWVRLYVMQSPMSLMRRRAFALASFYTCQPAGGTRTNEIYGDAIIPQHMSEKNRTDRFDLIDYLDDRQQFWAV